MLYSDFASAAVLISFGVIIGTTSPLQLIVMALIEIVLFFVNEVIGRKFLHVSFSKYALRPINDAKAGSTQEVTMGHVLPKKVAFLVRVTN